MCKECNQCFSEVEKFNLRDRGWNEKQIKFAEDSIIEDLVRKLIQ